MVIVIGVDDVMLWAAILGPGNTDPAIRVLYIYCVHGPGKIGPCNTRDVRMSVCVCVGVFVCLFDGLNQSVLTTMGSGLQGPQGPSSTQLGDWDLLFK